MSEHTATISVYPVVLSAVPPATAGRTVWRVAARNPGVSSGAIDFDHEHDARAWTAQQAKRLGADVA